VCRRNEPDMSQCIITAIKGLQPKLITGDLGDGFKVPPIEPFSLTK
jgi:Haemolymph juvenile hormone binding protein (JHBP)